MKDLLHVWGRVADRTYSAVGRAAEQPRRSRARSRALTCMLLAAASLGTGLFILLANPYDFLFNLKITFSEGGEIFEIWRKPPVKLYLRVYLFNVTNSEAFLAGREELHVQEVGPYVYRELLEHDNVTFNANGTLTTVPRHPLQWEPALSAPLTQEDVLTLPNIALLSLAHVASSRGALARLGVNALLGSTRSEPLLRMSARDFMFDHSSPLVSLGNSLLPGWIKFDRLGLIDRMYDFEGDYETVYTGRQDPRRAGLVATWRGAGALPHWQGACARVAGSSDGSKFPGQLREGEALLFYRKSMCRAAPMERTGREWLQGLETHRYEFAADILDNGHRNANNSCFCRRGACLPDGLIDVTDCYYGFPIALSYPHLLDARAPGLRVAAGMRASREQHASGMWIQPRSGLPLKVRARFQINMALSELRGVPRAARFSGLLLPLLWFEIGMDGLPDSVAARFRLYLNVLPRVEQAALWLSFALVPILLGLAVRALRAAAAPSTRRASGVYRACELPADCGAPFLARKPSTRRGVLSGLGASARDVLEELGASARDLARRLSAAAPDSDDADTNAGYSSGSGERASSEDEACELEVLDEELCDAAPPLAGALGLLRQLPEQRV